MKWILGLFAFVFCAASSPGFDEDLISQIEALSRRLRSEPGRAELFIQRADLLRRWGRLEAAMADLRQAQRLGASAPSWGLVGARTVRDAGHLPRALVAYSRYLASHPSDGGAQLERARLLVRMGRPLQAARAFDEMLATRARPEPDLVLARHRALLEAGQKQRAARGLAQGIEKLGPLVSLVLPLFELELELGEFDKALGRIDDLQSRVPRLDGWFLHRAQALERAGRPEQAEQAYRAALAKLSSLPQRRRSTQLAQSMLRSAQKALYRPTQEK